MLINLTVLRNYAACSGLQLDVVKVGSPLANETGLYISPLTSSWPR